MVVFHCYIRCYINKKSQLKVAKCWCSCLINPVELTSAMYGCVRNSSIAMFCLQKGAEGGLVSSSQTGHVLVSADFNGCIKVFVHKAKPKHSSLPASALA